MHKKIDTFYFARFIWIMPNVFWFYCLQSGIIWQQVVLNTVSFLPVKQVKWFSQFGFHNKFKSIKDLCWKDSRENIWYILSVGIVIFLTVFIMGCLFFPRLIFFLKGHTVGSVNK